DRPLPAGPRIEGALGEAEALGRALRPTGDAVSVGPRLGPSGIRQLWPLLRGDAGDVGARRRPAWRAGAGARTPPSLTAGAGREAAQLRAGAAHRPRRRARGRARLD